MINEIINGVIQSLNVIYMVSLFIFPQVALKTLIVIHRTLREGDPIFREELLNFQQRGRVLQMSNFKDDSSPIGKFSFLKRPYNWPTTRARAHTHTLKEIITLNPLPLLTVARLG